MVLHLGTKEEKKFFSVDGVRAIALERQQEETSGSLILLFCT
jgi:hypothetical protein